MAKVTVHDKMMALLSDGNPHTLAELRDCLYDNLGSNKTVHTQICLLRRSIKSQGLKIVSDRQRIELRYRLVRLVNVDDQ